MGTVLISASRYDAVIFDMDGVVTDTTGAHRSAWKEMFDEFLKKRVGPEARQFEQADYLMYVDGKPRYDGVQAFLESRDIDLPKGRPEDQPGVETVCGLGNLKDQIFRSQISDHGVDAYESTVELISDLQTTGLGTALITSSRNAAIVLGAAGLSETFEVVIDGHAASERGLDGKPAPDVFLAAAVDLKVEPSRTVVVEDAISGVTAGRAGRFGLVVGVARHDNHRELLAAGADITVSDLAEVMVACHTEVSQ